MKLFPSDQMINTLTTFSFALVSTSRLTRVIGKEFHKKGVAGLLELVHNSVVERVLVLLEPAGEVVGHRAGVVDDGEVRLLLAGLRRLRLDEAG